MSCKIVVVGSCNVDLVNYVTRMPVLGETMHGNDFKVSDGGKGANQAVMAAKLGSRVAMLARVGDDSFGHNYKETLKKYGIDTDNIIITENVNTGTASIFVVKESGDNCIIIDAGANKLLNVSDVQTRLPSLLVNSKVIVLQLEVDRNVTLEALRISKAAGVTTIFNAAPAFNNLKSEFFKLSDVLCVNETEASILTGKDVVVGDENSENNAIIELLKLGCKSVVFTMGKSGVKFAFSSDTHKIYFTKADLDQNKVVDTTGAGDAFIGTLAHFMALSDFKNLEDILTESIVKKACIVASHTVQFHGAQTSYPKFDDVCKQISF